MLEVKNVRCGYDNNEIIKGVSFNVEPGSNLCIVGPNGCGKSTLLKSIANLLNYKGSILLNGKEISKFNRKDLAKSIALMSQASSIYFPYTVYETVSLGRYAHLKGVFSRMSKSDEEIIIKSIENVGLLDLKDKLISELSGGQLQRVYLARAFAQDPNVILLDEPTNHLDLKYQIEMLEYLNKWSKENNKIVIAVLHDLNLVQTFGEKVVMMKYGKIATAGNAREVLNGDKLKEVYGIDVKTFMLEALEKWNGDLFKELFPEILDIIKEIDKRFVEELKDKGCTGAEIQEFRIINNNTVRMANLAIHVGHAVNGVAQLHTDILKDTELNNWYKLYPEKFQNKTNGITPRRWLRLCNKELSELITELLGNEDWVRDLSLLKNLEKYADDEKVLTRFMEIKHTKKEQLAKYIKDTEGVEIDPDSMFDIQIKRMHEYKRQLLNAFYILDLYFRIKENPEMDIAKTTFIFGAKAFPGYRRAKSIVKFINEIARLIDEDEEVSKKIKVHFVENYRVSYAEKLFPAADLSKQISTAGKEASGTGNMKFMLNGAPTFGTLDGANVEIVRESGEENNFIFGLKVEDIQEIQGKYKAKSYYECDASIRRVMDTLVDGTLSDGGTGDFDDLFDSLMKEGDQYFLLADFESFKKTEDEVFNAYKDKMAWAKKCFLNVCNAGIFSSDRTILQYADEIWDVKRTENK